MKDLLKIYRRYIFTAVSICTLVLIFNLLLLFCFLLNQFGYKTAENYASTRTSILSAQLTLDHGQYILSEDAQKLIDEQLAFAMLIDQEGNVIWSYHLPDDLPRTYSLTQVASFSRWYLEGYPVKIHIRPDGL